MERTAKPTTSWPPLTSLAMRSAASLASLPVERITFCSCGGRSAASSRHSSTTSGASTQLNRWIARSQLRAIAATTSG